MSGPFWGKIVDARGPRPLLISAFILLLSGYSGIRGIFDAGLGEGKDLSTLRLMILVFCSFISGVGGHAGMASAMNTTAKNFPDHLVSPNTPYILSVSHTRIAGRHRRSRHVRIWTLSILLFVDFAHTLPWQYIGFSTCTRAGHINSHDLWVFLCADYSPSIVWSNCSRGWILGQLSAIGYVH